MKKNRQTRIKDILILRSKIFQVIRKFLIDHNYLEIETPIRIPAPAPEAYIDAVVSGDWYLQTSPELCMKRMLAAGYPKLFQICKCFRQNERGSRHLPELTLLEWYTAGGDYFAMMDQTEALIRYIAKTQGFEDSIEYQDYEIDLKPPWPQISVKDAFREFAPISMETALHQDRFDEVVVSEIEPKLPREKPIFLYDYPAARAALARLRPDDTALAERFELYVGGLELCNGFTELTDPVEQRERFNKELIHRSALGKAVYPMPEKFLTSLQHMPNTAGNALGIDRLVMLFADATTIDDVVAFTPEEL
jgi:lysyl-tRNA synthetase class 2